MDIVVSLLLLILTMIWIISGLFVTFFMWISDKSKGENYKGMYWIKNRSWYFLRIIMFVIGGPVSLIIGIFVIRDLIDD